MKPAKQLIREARLLAGVEPSRVPTYAGDMIKTYIVQGMESFNEAARCRDGSEGQAFNLALGLQCVLLSNNDGKRRMYTNDYFNLLAADWEQNSGALLLGKGLKIKKPTPWLTGFLPEVRGVRVFRGARIFPLLVDRSLDLLKKLPANEETVQKFWQQICTMTSSLRHKPARERCEEKLEVFLTSEAAERKQIWLENADKLLQENPSAKMAALVDILRTNRMPLRKEAVALQAQ